MCRRPLPHGHGSVRRLGILLSGRGSNFQAIAEKIAAGELDAEIAVVISNRAPAPVQLSVLPVFAPKRRPFLMLPPPQSGSKEELIARVEQKFASGEQNYKAGHLEAARKDFDEAVDWMLESGYDLNGDTKLSELFHRVVDTVYADELQAFRAGDGFQEAPAVPAPIDEVAEMTFPVDPRLKERAEEAAKNLSHDLPLTVNDQVLSFLNFFQTPRGRAIVETGLRRAGRGLVPDVRVWVLLQLGPAWALTCPHHAAPL